ncbi:MAG: hypothetical protein AAGC95_03030 [Pseudomonadota bacterium]
MGNVRDILAVLFGCALLASCAEHDEAEDVSMGQEDRQTGATAAPEPAVETDGSQKPEMFQSSPHFGNYAYDEIAPFGLAGFVPGVSVEEAMTVLRAEGWAGAFAPVEAYGLGEGGATDPVPGARNTDWDVFTKDDLTLKFKQYVDASYKPRVDTVIFEEIFTQPQDVEATGAQLTERYGLPTFQQLAPERGLLKITWSFGSENNDDRSSHRYFNCASFVWQDIEEASCPLEEPELAEVRATYLKFAHGGSLYARLDKLEGEEAPRKLYLALGAKGLAPAASDRLKLKEMFAERK